MPISSNQVSNIISGQVGMFSASAQYAQAISNQYGFQSGGSIGIVDPRDRSGQELTAGNVGAMGARAPGMAMGAVGMAAMFGYAPRILDPFTGTANAVMRGFGGAGIGGAIGMGALTAGAYYGIGQLGAFATNNMVTGAQNRGLLNNQIGQIFPNMNARGLNAMASQVESMNRMGMGSIRELASLMQQGAATGALDTGSLNNFSVSFRKLVGNVRNVANVLNSTLTEASTAISQVRGMGVRSDQAASFLGTLRGIGTATNLSPRQLMGVAQSGANFGFQTGIDRQAGAQGAVVSAGVYALAQRNENLGIDAGAQGRYTQAATRFLMSSQGRTVLGAMMNEDGTFNARTAQMISMGVYGKEELRDLYKENISSARSRRLLRSRGAELAGEFISQFGPQAVSGSLEAMTAGDNQELLQRSLTGLNRRDIDTMRQLASYTPQLRQKLVQEARDGFREGQQSVTGMQMMGIAFDRLVKPIRDQFRRMGAGMTEAVSGAMEDVTNQLVRQPSFRGQYSDYRQMYHARQHSLIGSVRGMYDMQGSQDIFLNELGTMPDRATGYGSFLNYLPGMMRAGDMPMGGTPADMPLGGLTTLNPRDAMMVGGVGLALRAGIFPGNRNVVGATGQLMSMTGRQLGRGVDRLFPAAANQGFIKSLGGVGPVSGMARFPGGMLRFGGMMTRGLGVLGRFASPLMIGYGAMGALSETDRILGREGFAQGAFVGHNARMLHALRNMGALGDTHMPLVNVTGAGMSVDDMGGRPVSGLYDASGVADPSGGHQYALTPEGESEVQGFFSKEGMSAATSLRQQLIDRNPQHPNLMQDLVSRLTATSPTDRLTEMATALAQVPGAEKFTAAQRATLAMNTKGVLPGDSFDSRRRLRLNVSRARGKLVEHLEGDDYKTAGYPDKEITNIRRLGGLLRSAGGARNLQDAFNVIQMGGNTEAASMFVSQAIEGAVEGGVGFDNYDLAQGPNHPFHKDIMAALQGDQNHYLTQAVSSAAGKAGVPTFATQSLSPIEQFGMFARGQEKMDEFSINVGNKHKSVEAAVRLGGQYLGIHRNVGADIKSLATGQFDAVNESQNMSIVEHLINQNKSGNLPSRYALGRAGQEYMRDKTGIGEDRFATASNAYMALTDYNKAIKPGRRGANARFLSSTGRRMGLDIDFSKYKGKDDIAYLSGGKDKIHAISHELDMDLRSYGAALFELREGRPASEQEILAERNHVMDSLQAAGDSGNQSDLKEVIERLSSARAPVSPTSGKSASGGLQAKIGAVDQALDGLITVIKNKTGSLGGTGTPSQGGGSAR